MKRLVALVLVAGCSIPDQTFHPSADAALDDAAIDMASASDFVIDKPMLMITEGTSDSFHVQLGAAPPGVVSATVRSTSNAVTVDPTTIDFTPSSWNQPVTVTVSPAIDTNDVAEMSTVSVEASGLLAGTIGVKTLDPTVVATYGWPATPAFTSNTPIGGGSVVAYQITIPASTTLDKFGVHVPAGTGYFRMALYRDNANVPGALVAEIAARAPLVNGENVFDVTPDVPIDAGTTQLFWIALRTSANGAVSSSPTINGRTCSRDVDISNIDSGWPTTFGAATCTDYFLENLWIATYHQ